MLVILSGVAGAGKDTIRRELIKQIDGAVSIPSFTTRAPRADDVPGVTYHFITQEEFEKKIAEGEFYEYDIHHEKYYGTSKKILNEKAKSEIVIKDIDVNRNRDVKKYVNRYKCCDHIFKSSKRRITAQTKRPN